MRFYIPILCLIVAGCSKSDSTLVVKTTGEPISVGDVTVMMEFPIHYEFVADLECEDGGLKSGANNNVRQNCINDLKKRAARLGANGLVLTFEGEESETGGGVPVRNTMQYAESSATKLSAVAIYYLK